MDATFSLDAVGSFDDTRDSQTTSSVEMLVGDPEYLPSPAVPDFIPDLLRDRQISVEITSDVPCPQRDWS